MLIIKGRTAVVTGAGAGIGRALALEAARAGVAVAICDVAEVSLQETAAMLRDQGATVLARVVDVRDAAALQGFADACETLPDVALVWANAGVLRQSPAIKPDLDAWNFVIDVNLKGTVHTMAAFVPRLMAQASPSRFVITGSLGSFVAAPGIGSYIVSKHALWGLADTLRMELQQAGASVGVSLLAPQRVATDIIAGTVEKVRDASGEEGVRTFLAGLPTPEAIAAFAWAKAVAGDDLIMPDAAEAAPLLEARLGTLTKAMAAS
jgi:NAD(P)-dependent dehydrogenase (short-subunit alcohol dehydrogenase family)